MKYHLCLSGLLLTVACYVAGASQGGPSKEALQELQEYIGDWKGNGTSERDKTAIWKELAGWSWKFKGDDSWMTVEFKDSKWYKSGELRYLADKKVYELTLTDKTDKAQVFQGTLKKGYLTLERVDPASKATQQLKINTASGGDRLVITYAVKPENRTSAFIRKQSSSMAWLVLPVRRPRRSSRTPANRGGCREKGAVRWV